MGSREERRKNLMEKDISAAYHRPSGPSQDCRRIRLWDQNNAKKMHYISINSCNSPRANELRQLKDEIIAKIATIDNEINQIKQAFENCLNKVKMVKDKLKKKRALSENEDQSARYQSTASRIYAENKKRAEDFEKSFRNLNMNLKLELPIDERIIDGILDLNKERHCAFKDKLKKHLLEKKNAMDIERKQMEETFCKNMVHWKKRIEKIESSEEWKQGADECRKFFEKEFPDITVKECTENSDSNSEVRMEDMILNAAAIPPLLDSHARKLRYRDTNNFVGDFPKEYRERNQSYWTNEEKKIFKEQYLLHPKKFGVISSFLKNKSANDCVQYYYHSKKDENYKRLLRRSRKRKTSPSLYDEPEEAYLNSIAGVITRQQRTQILKELHEKKSKFETNNALSAVKESDLHFLKVTKTKSLILEGDASTSSKYSHAS